MSPAVVNPMITCPLLVLAKFNVRSDFDALNISPHSKNGSTYLKGRTSNFVIS
jgi:hypothetical protein